MSAPAPGAGPDGSAVNYRALGFHTAYGLFDRRDDFAKLDPAEFPQAAAHAELLDELFPRVTKGTPGSDPRLAGWLAAAPATSPLAPATSPVKVA
jgi:hypothetical protein